jgi:hypothetical protein
MANRSLSKMLEKLNAQQEGRETGLVNLTKEMALNVLGGAAVEYANNNGTCTSDNSSCSNGTCNDSNNSGGCSNGTCNGGVVNSGGCSNGSCGPKADIIDHLDFDSHFNYLSGGFTAF